MMSSATAGADQPAENKKEQQSLPSGQPIQWPPPSPLPPSSTTAIAAAAGVRRNRTVSSDEAAAASSASNSSLTGATKSILKSSPTTTPAANTCASIEKIPFAVEEKQPLPPPCPPPPSMAPPAGQALQQPTSASYSRLLSSSSGTPFRARPVAGRFRQHSMDASLAAHHHQPNPRAVKFFLESEGSDLPDNETKQQSHESEEKERSAPIMAKACQQRFSSPQLENSSPYRRTSLPVQSNMTRQNLYLQSQVNSARGLLMDLLASMDWRHDLPPNVTACLRAVTALLNPPSGQQNANNGTAGGGGTHQSTLSLTEFGLPNVLESPYSGEVHVPMTSKPRVSNITFSTVTSATGLPTIAAEPSRPRSSSYWKPAAAEGAHSSLHQLGGGRVGTGQLSSSSPSSALHQINHHNSNNRHSAPIEESKNEHCQDEVTSKEEENNNRHRKQRESTKQQESQSQQKSGRRKSAEKNSGSDGTKVEAAGEGAAACNQTASFIENTSTPGGQQHQQQKMPPNQNVRNSPFSTLMGDNIKNHHPLLEQEECSSSDQSSNGLDDSSAQAVASSSYKTVDSAIFDRAELERDPTLKQIQAWSFPIFHFAEKHKRTVLTRLTHAIFKEANLFRTFKISFAKFFNYFHALESGYWEIPYHNRIHAADVLHGCYYLTSHPVHAFYGYHSEVDEDEDREEGTAFSTGEMPLNETNSFDPNGHQQPHANQDDNDDDDQQHHQNNTIAHLDMNAMALPLAQSMSSLELMALYTAAAMHDYDHPGRTNAFLVASEDRKAILYNDRSVLENHHAAESWRLLTSQSQNHFIENLDSAETKRFRYLVLEYILATDLKQHFDIIMQFNERAPDMDLTNESDRVLISLMLIKFADINSPAKPYSLHRQWTDRICQEFYEQGDEEKLRNMAISPYMDRNEPAVAKLQDSFISHIVNPLAVALNEAGLLPILPGLPESELIINLKHNHQKWLQQIESEQQQKQLPPIEKKVVPITDDSIEIEQNVGDRSLNNHSTFKSKMASPNQTTAINPKSSNNISGKGNAKISSRVIHPITTQPTTNVQCTSSTATNDKKSQENSIGTLMTASISAEAASSGIRRPMAPPALSLSPNSTTKFGQ